MRLARKRCALRGFVSSWSDMDEDQVVPCRVVIALADDDISSNYAQWHLDALSLLLSPDLCIMNADGFKETREALLSMAPTPSARRTWETMKIQVCVRLLFRTEEPVNAVIKRLIHLKQARSKLYRNPERKDVVRRRSEFPFHVESIDFVYDFLAFDARRSALTPKMIASFKALFKMKGLRVRQFRFMELLQNTLRDESEYRLTGGDLWKSLTAAPTGLDYGLSDRQGAQVIDAYALACVEYLTVEGAFVLSAHGDEQLAKWRWLVYALFHASATHSIRSLEIRDTEIMIEHLLHVREFLDAPQPLQMMYPKECGPPYCAALSSTPKVGSFVTLAKHSPVYFGWNALNTDKNLIASSAKTQFRVVNSRDDKIGIIVPGYGDFWVRLSDVVSVQSDPFHEAPTKQWKLKPHGITALSIVVEGCEIDGSHEGVFELLALIGEPLTILSVQFCHYTQFLDRHFKKLLGSCQNLTELVIKGTIFGCLDAFPEAYESGMCRIASLDITESSHAFMDDSLLFARALSDPKTMLAQTLRHIRFGFEVDEDENSEDSVTESDVVMAFLSALETNNRLSFLELRVCSDVYHECKAAFKAFDGQYLSYSLPFRSKCAFLSVVRKAQSKSIDEALARMDTHVLSLIFLMASESVRRTVVLSMRHH